MTASTMPTVKELQSLFKSGLYSSVLILIGLISADSLSPALNLLYADTLVRTGQQMLALKYYEKGLKGLNLAESGEWAKAAVDRYIDACLACKEFYKAREIVIY